MSEDLAGDIASVERAASVPSILEVICRTTGMGFAVVARVTPERWVACAVRDEIGFGLKPGGELKLETTICNDIRQSGEPVVISHVDQDPTYSGHPTPAMYGFQSYISTPIILGDGSFFGTLCALDPEPAKLDNPETLAMFRLFAELIATHLDAEQKLAASEASLLDARKTAELREQFIAVLGHDLRNPLAAIDGGVRLLARGLADDRSRTIAVMMQQSVIRMAGLIDNVLDFARGRMGGGLMLHRREELLLPVLEHLIAELQTAWPDRRIEAAFSLSEPVNCDRSRISQLFSNLLANALVHGAAAHPVQIHGSVRDGVFELVVCNAGEPIPPEMLSRLFQPFVRGEETAGKQGLGLGLFIASEIAKAHGGKLSGSSSEEETRFTFTMPAAVD